MRTVGETHARARMPVLRALLVVATALALSLGRAHAETPAPDLTREAPVRVAAQGGGRDTPLGTAGIALEVDVWRRLVVAGGLGVNASDGGPYDFQYAIWSRYRLWSLGNTSVSAGLGFSYNEYDRDRLEGGVYQRPNYGMETVLRRWPVVIRLNPEISIEHRFGRRWTLRGFGGVGAILTEPTCTYSTPLRQVQGCQSPDLPVVYRYDRVRLLPYGGVAVAASLPGASMGVADSPWFVSPWYGWQILLSDVAAAAAALGGSDSSTVSTDRHLLLYSGVALYAFGGPIIHVTHKNEGRALISFALRTLPTLLAVELLRGKIGDQESGRDNRVFIPLATTAAAAIIDWTVLGWSRGGGGQAGDRVP
jgi:hypothetical protein